MKLDLNAAWDQAVRLLAMNREVMLVLGGVFFFLPSMLFLLLIPMPDFSAISSTGGNANAALSAAVNGFITQYWWAIVLLSLVQTAGAIAVMAVTGDPARPTVGTAMKRGGLFLISGIAAQMLAWCAFLAVSVIAMVLGLMIGSQTIANTLGLFSLPVGVWLLTRLSLAGAVISIEKTANPLAALARSWRLTRGSALRLVAFYVLLFAAFFVVTQVAALVVGLLVALPGAQIASILDALLSSLIYAVPTLLGYAVLSSVHRQFARAERVAAPDREQGL